MNTVHQKGPGAAAVRGVLGALFGALFGLVAFYPSWRFRGMFEDGETACWIAIGLTSLAFALGCALGDGE